MKKNVTNFVLAESKTILKAIDCIVLKKSDVFVVADENVTNLYGDEFKDLLRKNKIKFHMISLPAGEVSKTREMKSFLEDKLIQFGAVKDSLLIAFGGGVISDLVGFTAATYMRSVSYFIIPTSLIGIVDASIGGKVAVNTPDAKNMIGAFYSPEQIFCEPKFLETLPKREFRAGFMEVIKYGLIWDRNLFGAIYRNNYSGYLKRSIEIKKEIVERDPTEKGLRRILNYGHTIGHAIEVINNYQILHGEGLWCGLLIESHLSYKMKLLSKESFFKIVSLLTRKDIVIDCGKEIELQNLHNIVGHDKKSKDAKPRFVMISEIGKTVSFDGDYCTFVTKEMLDESLKWFKNEIQNT